MSTASLPQDERTGLGATPPRPGADRAPAGRLGPPEAAGLRALDNALLLFAALATLGAMVLLSAGIWATWAIGRLVVGWVAR